jgi:signal peptidase I
VGAQVHDADPVGLTATPPATAGGASEPEEVTRSERRRNAPLVLGVVAVLALIAIRVFVAEPFRIPSESMAPVLEPGDQALVTKLGGTPGRGKLVAFHAPRTGEVMLKRVVAVGGDRVGIEDGVLVVNGARQREAYVADPDAIDSVYFGPVTVAKGSLFVLGDNRANSEDSRDFGAVPADRVIGRATARVWPPSRWGATH